MGISDPKMEVPTPKIWPYMVQYLHFRILEFPLITFLEIYPYISHYVGYMSRFWTLEIIKRMKNSTQPTLAKQLTPQPIDDVLGFGLVLWNILEWWGRPVRIPVIMLNPQIQISETLNTFHNLH